MMRAIELMRTIVHVLFLNVQIFDVTIHSYNNRVFRLHDDQ
jgi:hypothetical protein